MNTPASGIGGVAALALRWVIGGLFLYMGLAKALDPAAFLKLVHQYDLVRTPLLLNLVAAGLPWFEVLCGLLLLLGVGVRGTSLLLVAMLVPFTLVVLNHALELQAAGNRPFCAIKFDCGCGTGEVLVCRKLFENALLTVGAVLLLFRKRHALVLWPRA